MRVGGQRIGGKEFESAIEYFISRAEFFFFFFFCDLVDRGDCRCISRYRVSGTYYCIFITLVIIVIVVVVHNHGLIPLGRGSMIAVDRRGRALGALRGFAAGGGRGTGTCSRTVALTWLVGSLHDGADATAHAMRYPR